MKEGSGDEVKLGRYRHFKGGECEVIGIAHHSETQEDMVVYRCLYNAKDFGEGSLWVRPKKMFLETVERDGKVMKRFEFLG